MIRVSPGRRAPPVRAVAPTVRARGHGRAMRPTRQFSQVTAHVRHNQPHGQPHGAAASAPSRWREPDDAARLHRLLDDGAAERVDCAGSRSRASSPSRSPPNSATRITDTTHGSAGRRMVSVKPNVTVISSVNSRADHGVRATAARTGVAVGGRVERVPARDAQRRWWCLRGHGLPPLAKAEMLSCGTG